MNLFLPFKNNFLNKRFAIFLCLTLLLGKASSQDLKSDLPENNGMSSLRLSNIHSVFLGYVTNKKLPGAVILVARNGNITYHKSFGMSDLETQVPMTNDKIFRIASQTKALVSVGIMMLQEEGKLLLSDSLSRYIPEFEQSTVEEPVGDGKNTKEEKQYRVVKAKRAITIRDLLTHTSGIGYGYGLASEQWKDADLQGWYFAHKKEPILESVKKLGRLPMEKHPGESFVYGYSTDVLGALIEVVSGKTLNVFIKERILDPLGMNDTSFYLPIGKASRISVVYNQKEDGLVRAPEKGEEFSQGQYLNGPRTSFSGGAGLLSTSKDYAIFLQMLLNNGKFNGKRILSRKSVELMTANQLGGDYYKDVAFPWDFGTGFGLGFSITDDFGDRGVLGNDGEYGWGGAYHSSYFVNPEEQLVVVYFTQVVPISLDDHQKLKALVYQSIVD